MASIPEGQYLKKPISNKRASHFRQRHCSEREIRTCLQQADLLTEGSPLSAAGVMNHRDISYSLQYIFRINSRPTPVFNSFSRFSAFDFDS